MEVEEDGEKKEGDEETDEEETLKEQLATIQDEENKDAKRLVDVLFSETSENRKLYFFVCQFCYKNIVKRN